MKKEGTIYTIIFIFIVSFVFVFLLSLTNQQTIELVELNEELVRQGAVLSAMGIAADTPEEIQDRYRTVASDPENGLYVATVGGTTVYGAQFSGPGLWGAIDGVLAVSEDLSRIIGLELLADNETPGLGGRINESWFKEQFRGEDVSSGRIVVAAVDGEGDRDPDNGIVDSVTGATRTSESMEVIVNSQLEALRSAETTEIFNRLKSEGAQS